MRPSDTIMFVLGALFIGLVLGRLLPGVSATAAVPAAPVALEQPSPLTEPLTRAVYIEREPCECARYRMVSLPGTDHTAVIVTGGDIPTGQGGIAQPELPE